MRKGKADSDASPDKGLSGSSSPGGSGAEITGLFERVAAILDGARSSAARAVNSRMVLAYWLIGREIVQELQAGEDRADYGKAVIDQLSARLAKHYGTGFSSTNLKSFRLFYLCYTDREPAIRHTLLAELPELSAGKSHTACAESGTHPAFHPALSWSHYRAIMRVEKREAREFYEQEAVASSWSVRQLERQIHSFYYERLLASSDRSGMIAAERHKGENHPAALFKSSTVLEFLGLPDPAQLHESDLEQAIIDNLQAFLLEMGRGFAFVDRQKHIRFEDD
jgi:predicted nuclease of restriction endonuclease-like (RecB) superfamily